MPLGCDGSEYQSINNETRMVEVIIKKGKPFSVLLLGTKYWCTRSRRASPARTDTAGVAIIQSQRNHDITVFHGMPVVIGGRHGINAACIGRSDADQSLKLLDVSIDYHSY